MYKKLQTQDAIRIQISTRCMSSKFTILYCYFKFSAHGEWLNWTKGNSGRPRSSKTERNMALAQNMLQRHPRGVSCRRSCLRISGSTFN